MKLEIDTVVAHGTLWNLFAKARGDGNFSSTVDKPSGCQVWWALPEEIRHVKLGEHVGTACLGVRSAEYAWHACLDQLGRASRVAKIDAESLKHRLDYRKLVKASGQRTQPNGVKSPLHGRCKLLAAEGLNLQTPTVLCTSRFLPASERSFSAIG